MTVKHTPATLATEAVPETWSIPGSTLSVTLSDTGVFTLRGSDPDAPVRLKPRGARRVIALLQAALGDPPNVRRALKNLGYTRHNSDNVIVWRDPRNRLILDGWANRDYQEWEAYDFHAPAGPTAEGISEDEALQAYFDRVHGAP